MPSVNNFIVGKLTRYLWYIIWVTEIHTIEAQVVTRSGFDALPNKITK